MKRKMGSVLSDEDESRPLEPEVHPSFCPSSSVASSSTDRWSYDVFLSFRGEDTRKKFTGHLKAALDRAGVKTFMDDVELRRGEEIGSSLFKAIEGSRISIPIFSVNYASSKWCLRELAKIIECKDKQKVLPIFFDVDPSDVRNQRGSFSKAFRRHEKRFPKEEVQRWREALRQAGSLSGFNLKEVGNGDEPQLISLVVKEVLRDLNKISFDVALHPVGIESRVEDMMKYLQLESPDVLFVGIWGLGGIGKTTIAKAVLNKISSDFEYVCFLADIKEVASQKGIATLQKRLLDILLGGYEDVNIDGRGKMVIKERLCSKKVALILDDVNDVEQLKELAGQLDWFGPGSRIIITTRDEHTLIKHQVGKIYEPEELDLEQSLRLFSRHAFCKDQPPEDYREISKKFVETAGGLPLVLEIFGSSLSGMEIIEWENELDKLKNIPSKKVQDRLKLSYEGLDEFEKEIFLDTACFFIGMDKDLAITIWEGCEFCAKAGITGLIHKSLVKIDYKNTLRMHDHIRDMGREIVRQENRKEPMMRSRLWMHKEVMSVLAEPTTTRSIEGIHVDFENEKGNLKLSIEAFAMMPKLRLLKVDYATLEGEYKRLPKDLKWFSWRGCPLNYIPTTIDLPKLVALDLENSNIRQDQNCLHQNKLVFEKLKVLNLSSCDSLIGTPNFSGLLCLESLILKRCRRLVEIDETIGHLKRLVFLDLESCSNLRELPSSICECRCLKILLLSRCDSLANIQGLHVLEALENLDMSYCTSIERLPDLSKLKRLKKLDLRLCWMLADIQGLHGLEALENLDMEECTSIERLEDLSKLKRLKKLDLRVCVELADIQGLHGLEALENLDMSYCTSIERLPDLSKLKRLKKLDLQNCEKLADIQGLHGLEALENVDMYKCTSIERLEDLSKLKRLEELGLRYCEKLADIQGLHGLEALENLDMTGCTSIERLPDLSNLKRLKGLNLRNCEKLADIQGLNGLEALEKLSLVRCTSIEILPDLSDLKELRILDLSGCSKLAKVELNGKWKALSELYLDGCSSALENSLEITLAPGAFECLRKLIFPGREIPDWFTPLQLSYNKMQPGHDEIEEEEGETRLVWNPEHHEITILRVLVCFVLANQEEEEEEDYTAIDIGVDVRRDGELVLNGSFDFWVGGTDQKDRLYICRIQEEKRDLDTRKDLWALEMVVKVSFQTTFPVKKAGIHVSYK